MKTALLPVGYPNSVPPEYFNYQQWNLVQAMCSYFRTIMSTASVLEGFGVGNPDMTAVGATVQWIIRDGVDDEDDADEDNPFNDDDDDDDDDGR